jgi:indolepyruvate ferredoxin oxidoreductase beta subunit
MPVSQPIKIAIVAMGGEGGGVLADWIVDLAEHNGHLAQTTSVPGVAQRTGTTLYYVELYPRAQAQADGATPVLALMPLPGDVDVVLASELMEAGRAIQRGLVTPERTTLVASTHRVYSMTEKAAMGDGRVDSAELLAHAADAAKRFVGFDMAAAAVDSGSVIGAVLFGALAGTGVLPFERARFEETIERSGVGVAASMKAFGAAFERARSGSLAAPGSSAVAVTGSAAATAGPAGIPAATAQPRAPEVRALLARVSAEFPEAAQRMLTEGVRRLVDYQDPAWAATYLDRLARVKAAPGGDDPGLLAELARHLALWMSWEDTIRVAELKTRGSRFERVRAEVRVADGQLLAIDEYLHPRVQEIAESMPAALGRWLLASGWPRRLLERFTARGRIVTTSSLRGFLLLYATAGMKRWRRATLRYALEQARIEQWLRRVEEAAAVGAELATEVARCQRLVKGYGDTHERGLRNYETLMAALGRGGASVTPATVRELRDAALADEHGAALQAALARHALATA